MSKLPYMQFYPTDFLMDVQTMNMESRGAWITLLCHIWHQTRDGTIRMTNKELAILWQTEEDLALEIFMDMVEANLFDYRSEVDPVTKESINFITSRRISRDRKRLKQKANYASRQRVDIESTQYRQKVDGKKSEVIKDKDRDRDLPSGQPSFKKPTIAEIESYCRERNNFVNAVDFFDHYEANGWFRGKTKIKDWRACVRTWERKESQIELGGDDWRIAKPTAKH